MATREQLIAQAERAGFVGDAAVAKVDAFMKAHPEKFAGDKPATTKTEAKPEAKAAKVADKAPVAPKPSPAVAAKVAPSPSGPRRAPPRDDMHRLPDTVLGRAANAATDRDVRRDRHAMEGIIRDETDADSEEFVRLAGTTDPVARFKAYQQRQGMEEALAPKPSPMDYLGDAPAPKPIGPAPAPAAVAYAKPIDKRAALAAKYPKQATIIKDMEDADVDEAYQAQIAGN